MVNRLFFAVIFIFAAGFSTPSWNVASDKRASSTDQISGMVVDFETQLPISNTQVNLYYADAVGDNVTSTVADAFGRYHFGELASDVYFVVFSATGYARGFYPNQLSVGFASPITITSGSSIVADGHLRKLRALRGKAVNEQTGLPLPGISIYIDSDPSGSKRMYGSTDANGYYIFPNLLGIYQITISSLYGSHYSYQQRYVSVGLESDAVENFYFSEYGALHGRIVDAETNMPVPDIPVFAYSKNGSLNGYASTNIDGVYAIGGLSPGEYRVKAGEIISSARPTYAYQFFDNQPLFMSATPVDVRPGETITVNLALRMGGVISAQQHYKATGLPSTMPVTVCPAYEFIDKLCKTGMNWFSGLPDTPLNVYVNNFAGYEYYEDTDNPIFAAPVTSTAGMTTFVDIQVHGPAYIKGLVLDEQTSQPVSASVLLYGTENRVNIPVDYLEFSYTDEEGKFSLRPFQLGSYKVLFAGGRTTGDRFYNDKPDWESADVITLTRGETRYITETLPHLQGFGAIAGKVVLESGQPYASPGWVQLMEASPYVYGDHRNSQGEFLIENVKPGKYKIKFWTDRNYPYFYYNQKPSLWTGDWITVSAGLTTNIVTTVPVGIEITGHIVDRLTSSSVPFPYLAIADAQTGDDLGYAKVDDLGRFEAKVFGASTYRLFASDGEYMSVFSPPLTVSDHGLPNVTLYSDNATCVDVSEPDDSPLFAVQIQVNKPSPRRYGCQKYDVDWSYFDIANSGVFTVESYNLNGLTDTNLELYRLGDGGELRKMAFNDDVVQFGDTRSRVALPLDRGRYFIKMQALGHDGSRYFYDSTVQYDMRVVGPNQPILLFLPIVSR